MHACRKHTDAASLPAGRQGARVSAEGTQGITFLVDKVKRRYGDPVKAASRASGAFEERPPRMASPPFR
jgi:hypothetical protein